MKYIANILRIIYLSYLCVLSFLLDGEGKITQVQNQCCSSLRTVAKMRRLERLSYGWPLSVRSCSHCRAVIMASAYLSDCRDYSISCDNNLLEQGRKRQTSKRCCHPIPFLSTLHWLLSGEYTDRSCAPENSCARKQEVSCSHSLPWLLFTWPDPQCTLPHKYNFMREEFSFLLLQDSKIFQSKIVEYVHAQMQT